MATLTATEARHAFFDIIKGASEQHETYHIKHQNKNNVVLLSEEDYEGLLETLELLSIPDFRKRIVKSMKQVEAGETFSMQDVFNKK